MSLEKVGLQSQY